MAATDKGPSLENRLLPERLWACHGRILAFLRYRTSSDELAEDILSETYLAFLQGGAPNSAFRDDQALRNYLMTVAVNKLRDHYRRAGNQSARRWQFRSREGLDQWLDNLVDEHADPAARVVEADDAARRQRLVASVMAVLPDRYRVVLNLKFTQDQSNPEIARRMELGIKAVESLLVRAKAAFRAEFERQALANEGTPKRVNVGKGRRP
jgi:RNA polymerase sigma-70 factor (ECF subfamily)